MCHATIYTLDQLMFAGGIGIELARTWENEIDNWGTCESPLKFGGVGWPCHDLPYLPRTPREPIMPSRVKSRQLACHLPDGVGRSDHMRWYLPTGKWKVDDEPNQNPTHVF